LHFRTNKTTSPPELLSKKPVQNILSVSNIVKPEAKTGTESNNKKAVKKTDHTNKGNLYIVKPFTLILSTVVIKFILPKIDDTPATCKDRIPYSTEPPE